MTQIKICGVNDAAAFDAVVAAGADFAGFIFFDRSPRFLTPLAAAALSARHEGGPLRVGLFVEPAAADVRAVLAAMRLDVLQIYADADRCRALKAEFGMKTWRAVSVASAIDLPLDHEGLDGFVIEPKAPLGATRPGGNAAALDLALLDGWPAPGFWLLAGGLNPENVAAAIGRTGAPAVDVSSGVETAPGRKSPKLIAAFVAAARGGPAAQRM